ncbi:MAG: AraC family transcriptional regulator [Candidatus Reconcilbacillus cellulovorans]|uniref:AraC family transcriptional regulator n=1 Tax=Candidatus Reconcilbacillus cellulovorans TaxID=1906605 RepID=A0A2A6E0X8_9BACL|nr:MAG: AraC family transcriptional regulator [Candidatus Reconcilbacillus cellulovorans]
MAETIESYENVVPEVVYFVDRRCFPDWEIAEQRIDFHDLTFVVGGMSDYYVDGEKHTLQAGDVIYIPPGCVRRARTYRDRPMRSYAFNFVVLHPANNVRLPLPTVGKGRATPELLRQVRDFLQVWVGRRPGYRMQARGLFHLLLYRLLSEADPAARLPPDDWRIARVMQYVLDHYAEPVDLKTLADMVGLHPVCLSALFRQKTRMTLTHYVASVRVGHAEMMLSTGEFRVREVAERCGFQDVSYFCKTFKAIKGYPPSQAVARAKANFHESL